MNILGREFVTEQMPEGWVICGRWIDGVLNIIERDCRKLGVSPEYYWQTHNSSVLTKFSNNRQ